MPTVSYADDVQIYISTTELLPCVNLCFPGGDNGKEPAYQCPGEGYGPGTALPGSQGVVGHIGKVQKWEEVLGANHAKALGEVGVHPVGEERNRLVGEHLPWP